MTTPPFDVVANNPDVDELDLPPVNFTVNGFKCSSSKQYVTTRQILEIAGYDIDHYLISKDNYGTMIHHYVLDDNVFVYKDQEFFARLRST